MVPSGRTKTVFGSRALTPSKTVENWIAVKTASGLGVTGPANKASIATGKKGVGVKVGVSETKGVGVSEGVNVIVGDKVMVGVRVIVGVSEAVGEGG